MLSSSLKFDITTLRSLSARASCSDNSAYSHTNCDDESNGEPPGGTYDLYGVLEAVNSLSRTHDLTDSEASLVLDLVRAKREVFQAQKTLADSAAEKKLDETDIGLGFVDHTDEVSQIRMKVSVSILIRATTMLILVVAHRSQLDVLRPYYCVNILSDLPSVAPGSSPLENIVHIRKTTGWFFPLMSLFAP
ncbi:uncharacterized protein F5147DRAFT_781788 [Suillus discolor]|uniref:Uncharacterized protein n=1 Tax=Suillus discolor TaxID=1912936 RepID=A0A9P7JLD8_9AGAM|nr:uncharacterized protein F5147DRAFT_781788 [Suillus discolor]KAG2086082.1 hypothetical protein F5147DRAFT_781788 [Suillus discolor]